MALRIAGSKTGAKPDPTQAPQADPVSQLLSQAQGAVGPSGPTPATDPDDNSDDDSSLDSDSDNDSDQGNTQVDQNTAGYQGPDQGPFMCANCVFYEANGPESCALVAGKINHMGCCNLFTSAHSQAGLSDQDTGDDEGDAGNMQQTGTSQPVSEPDEPEGT